MTERTAEVDERAAGLTRRAPMGAGELRVAAKKREIAMLEVVRVHRLDEGRLSGGCVQLPDGLVIVHEAEVGIRPSAFEDVLHFLTQEGGSADYGKAESSVMRRCFLRRH